MPNKEMFDVLKYQEGGDHYKKMKVQPAFFINENKLPKYSSIETALGSASAFCIMS